ncbi:MAG: ABC transporter ATP-binding protein [Anaerolineales bacterium]
MIEVHDLVKRYGAFTALDHISFKAPAKQIIGFLGPNGAGKTTTMRILTGYMPPTAGRATVAGYDVVTESLDVRAHIGYLPEHVPLYPDMTVRGYVEYIGALRGLGPKKKRQAARAALERVDLADRSNSLVRNISKGMRQRLGLAQAIVHDPPVLILDEPTIGLDPQQVRDVRAFIRELGKDHTIIFSTHILSEAEQICDAVIIINRGQILAQDSPDHLRDRLQVSGRIFVRTRQPRAKLMQALQSLPGLAAIDYFQDGVAVRPADQDEIRPRLAAAVQDAGLELLELRALAMSLEDIFLEITEGNLHA